MPPSDGQYFLDEIRDARLVLIPAAGHLPQFGRTMIPPQNETQALDWNNQQVMLQLSQFGSAVVVVRTQQTAIEMSGTFDKGQAIQLLNSLVRIQ